MGLLKTATKGLAWTTASTVIRSVVSMLQVAILTRYLDKTDFGIVAIATLFIGFIQIFLDLGLSVGIMHKQDTTSEQYSSLFWLNIFCGLILTLLLMSISPLIADYYEEPLLVPILLLLSTTMFFSSLGSQHRTVQQKLMRFNIISIVEIVTSILTGVIAIILVIGGWGIYSLVLSTLFNIAFSNILFLIIGLRNDKNISLHFNIKDTYPYLKIGVFTLGTQVLDYFSREMDIVIISSTLGKDVLGIYSLCKKFVLALYQAINPIIVKVMTPMLASIQQDLDKVKRVYFDTVESLALINFPIYFVAGIFSLAVLNFLYGEDYQDGNITLSLLLIHYGNLTTGNPIGSLQTALGRTDTGFYWTICRIILYSFATYFGSIFGLEWIVAFLIIITILSSPLSWRITIKPLLDAGFFEVFFLTYKPFIIVLLYSLPFYFFFSQITNLFMCLGISIVYLSIYIFALFKLRKDSYLISILKRGAVKI